MLDDLAYYGNWITRIVGFIRSKGKETVQFRIPRQDSVSSFHEVKAHLKAHGIDTHTGLHDSKYVYFSVSKAQAGWVRYLYNETTGQIIHGARSTWTENRTGKKRKMNFWDRWF